MYLILSFHYQIVYMSICWLTPTRTLMTRASRTRQPSSSKKPPSLLPTLLSQTRSRNSCQTTVATTKSSSYNPTSAISHTQHSQIATMPPVRKYHSTDLL